MGGLASLLSLAVATSLAAPVSGTEDASIRAHFATFANAWIEGDARKVAASYADDADLLRPNQPLVVGRDAIEAFYAQMLGGPLKGVAKTTNVERIRLVTPTVAVVDSSYTLDRDEPPLHARGASLTVLEKRGGRWLSVLSRSYRLP